MHKLSIDMHVFKSFAGNEYSI